MNTISVCLATYQGESYIVEQLDSLRNQTMNIDEVIVFDDQSKDQTESIVREYIHNNDLAWRFYKQEKNVGYIKNFASALEKSTGDIIFLCDQDDLWECNKVECMMDIFQQHPEVTCINTSFTYMNAHKQIIPQEDNLTNYGMLWNAIEPHTYQKINFEEILYHNISMGCTMAFRSMIKDIYLEHSSLTAPHDWEINRIAAMQEGLYFYQEKLIRYRIHENNTVGNDNVNGKSNEKRIKNAETMYRYEESYQTYRALLNDTQKHQCNHVYTLSKKRYKVVSEKKKLHWFTLLLHICSYRKIVSYKGMLADVLYK